MVSTRKRPLKSAVALQVDKYEQVLAGFLGQETTLTEGLENNRKRFAEILKDHVVLSTRGELLADMGDGWKLYKFPADPTPIVADAIWGMDLLFLVQRAIVRNDLGMIVQYAFKLGYCKSAIEVARPMEPLANVGWDITEARKNRLGKGKLTALEKADANRWYKQKREAKGSVNAAILHAHKLLNKHTPKRSALIPCAALLELGRTSSARLFP